MNQISLETLTENDLQVDFKEVFLKHPFKQLHKDDHFNQKTAQAFLDFTLGDQWKLEEYAIHKS